MRGSRAEHVGATYRDVFQNQFPRPPDCPSQMVRLGESPSGFPQNAWSTRKHSVCTCVTDVSNHVHACAHVCLCLHSGPFWRPQGRTAELPGRPSALTKARPLRMLPECPPVLAATVAWAWCFSSLDAARPICPHVSLPCPAPRGLQCRLENTQTRPVAEDDCVYLRMTACICRPLRLMLRAMQDVERAVHGPWPAEAPGGGRAEGPQ